jgi:uncharacterized membrane protein YfcA
MIFLQFCLLFVAAILGGALNSVAGGGSFIAFPALIFTGVPPINANATNTVALWPGSVASTAAYRKELAQQQRSVLIVLSGMSLIGGTLGALLLLHTSQATFVRLIPYLLLVATLLFAFGGRITTYVRERRRRARQLEIDNPSLVSLAETQDEKLVVPSTVPSRFALAGIALIQLVIATYGGYFGGGIGILMLAALGLMGMENIHVMNALKTLLTSFINGVAVITFAIAGAVVWPQALLMVIGAIIGGYGGAYLARKIDPRWVRLFVILVGFGMTIYFFIRQ